jgi:regulator of sirC expression with transglutaminase-like and TPR domain
MDLDSTLELLAQEPGAAVDPIEVALHLARDEYPNLNVEDYQAQLDGMAHEARPYLGQSFESRIAGLCRFLFHEVGFAGNQTNYYDPRNSYLNEVLDRLTGIPITLSLLTMAIGQRLGLTIEGLALPGHFVVVARERDEQIIIDPFEEGRRLDIDDCEKLVREATGVDVQLAADSLPAAPVGAVITRMLTNLKGCYLRMEEFRRAARVIRRLRQVSPEDWTQARDLGACYLHAGQAGKAIDAFELYLDRVPKAIDRLAVRKLLRRAQSEVARWN